MSSISRTNSIATTSPMKEVSAATISIPTPVTPGSEEWKTAQLIQKKTEAELNGEVLSPSQIKRFKIAIAKNAKSFNDKRISEENTFNDESVRKQIRKDAKKQRNQLIKQEKIDEEACLASEDQDQGFVSRLTASNGGSVLTTKYQ